MAKKAPASKAPIADTSKQLITAIATVKQLQDFIRQHGTPEQAVTAAQRVHDLIEMTGSFEALKQALEIVGQDAAPQQ